MADSSAGKKGLQDAEGYCYHLKSSHTNKANIVTKYYSCNNDKKFRCEGTLRLLIGNGINEALPKAKHNDACSEQLAEDKKNGKQKLKAVRTEFFNQVASDPTKSCTYQTYKDVMAKQDLDVSKKLPYAQIARQARRIKSEARKSNVTLPALKNIKKIEEFGAALVKSEESGKQFSFRINDEVYPVETIVLDGNDEKEGYTILWYVESHIQQYEDAKLSTDGTFTFCPALHNRHNHQFYTIMADRQGGPLPICFALMTRKTGAAYEKLFRTLQEKFPKLNAMEMMADFEQAPQNAAEAVWPGIQIIGCFFHSSQNIEKHIKSTGVIQKKVQKQREDPRKYKFKRKAQSLALLRPHDIDEGFRIVSEDGEDLNDDNVPEFLSYLKKTWLSKKTFSVFGHVRRTNNALESSHSVLGKLGKGPALSVFCENIADRFREAIMKHAQIDHLAAQFEEKGNPTETAYYSVCEKTSSQRRYDKALIKAWEYLENGTWSVSVFLEKMSSVTSKKFPMKVTEFLTTTEILAAEDSINDDEMEPVELNEEAVGDAVESDKNNLDKEAIDEDLGPEKLDDEAIDKDVQPPLLKKNRRKRKSHLLFDTSKEMSQEPSTSRKKKRQKKKEDNLEPRITGEYEVKLRGIKMTLKRISSSSLSFR